MRQLTFNEVIRAAADKLGATVPEILAVVKQPQYPAGMRAAFGDEVGDLPC